MSWSPGLWHWRRRIRGGSRASRGMQTYGITAEQAGDGSPDIVRIVPSTIRRVVMRVDFE